MIARTLRALLLLGSIAAAPAPGMPSLPLPEPPVPPDVPPMDEAAPVPNVELFAPLALAPSGPRLAPDLISPQRQFRGDGFVPGSSPQSVEERTVQPTPGFKLLVPLQ